MATKQARSDIGFSRCAVCKIDLKGRFVYLDDKIETLLGCTKEELFGKSLLDFLDKPSQTLVEELLAQRNHYEIFYDSTTITLCNREGFPVTTHAVVSLNFIAGNPVNFQLILDWPGADLAGSSPGLPSVDYRAFLTTFLEIESYADWKPFLNLLCALARAEKACLYLISEDDLQPRWAVCAEGVDEFVFNNIPEPGELHREVALTGNDYSFIEQESVQSVVEKYGVAPNEFVSRLQLGENTGYLVRLVFAEDFDHQAAQLSIADARLALRLVCRAIEGSNDAELSSDDAGIKFAIGFLDSLGIGSYLVDAEGDIVGYNPSALNVFSESQLEGNYLQPIESLQSPEVSDLRDRIVGYVTESHESMGPITELVLRVKTSPANYARLVVLKLGDSSRDLSSCFVLIPDQGGGEDLPSAVTDFATIHAVLDRAVRSARTQARNCEKLAHSFFNELGDGGNELLGKIDADAGSLKAWARSFQRFVRMIKADEEPRTVDLNLLVEQQLRNLLTRHHGAKVNCDCSGLPKVTSPRKLLGRAVGYVLSNSIKYNDKDQVNIKIAAEAGDGRAWLEISDNGFGIDAQHLSRVCDFFYRVPDKRVEEVPGQGLGLAFAKKIMESIGGEISITSTDGEGTSVRLSFPNG